MKNLLTQTNLMWAAIAVLTVSSYNLHQSNHKSHRGNRGMVERMVGMKKAPSRGERSANHQNWGRGNEKNRGNSKENKK